MKFIKILFLFIFIAGCSSVSNSSLAGSWQAVSIEIDDQSIETDLSEVNIFFDKKGGYHFSSTLNYREAGYYQIGGEFLYTKDTLDENSKEKKVEIVDFSQGFMLLKMQEGKEERVIKFRKQ